MEQVQPYASGEEGTSCFVETWEAFCWLTSTAVFVLHQKSDPCLIACPPTTPEFEAVRAIGVHIRLLKLYLLI